MNKKEKQPKVSNYHQGPSGWVCILYLAIPVALFFGALLIGKYIVMP